MANMGHTRLITITALLVSVINCLYPSLSQAQRREMIKDSFDTPAIPGLRTEIMHSIRSGDWRRSAVLMNKHLSRSSEAYNQLQSIKGYFDLPLTAAKKGYIDLIKVLLANDLPIDRGYSFNHNMLHFSAMYGHDILVEFLITHGANVHIKDRDGMTALHWAAYVGDVGIVVLLVENGADINVRNGRGSTPLHMASYNRREEVVQWLVDHGCDKEIENIDGKTALELAKGRGYTEIVDILS